MSSTQATPDTNYPPAAAPTMYFIGVTTGKSSIMKIFPHWAAYLGLDSPDRPGAVQLRGIDCKLHDNPATYRRIVEHVKRDPLSKGALVTTHKIDLLKACRDMFDRLDEHAELMHEVSSISKREGKLVGRAFDLITSGLALQAFLPGDHWRKTKAHALVLGAGGSSIALTSYLLAGKQGNNLPAKIIVTNRSPGRLEEARQVHQQVGVRVPVEYHHTPRAEDNDALMAKLPPGSLVANATGLGKDMPGSPITNAAVFPQRGYAWDFNYRGDLVFLDQARAQHTQQNLHIEDGWIYFIHGWSRVIAEVFDINIPTAGPAFDKLSELAAAAR